MAERRYTLEESAQIFMRCAEDMADKYWSEDNPNNTACKLLEIIEGVESYRDELRKYEVRVLVQRGIEDVKAGRFSEMVDLDAAIAFANEIADEVEDDEPISPVEDSET